MDAIVAVDNNWAIGFKGDLLISIPEDQRDVFRKYTFGHSVILGRKTLETFPGRKPLPGRKHIVMSRNSDLKIEGAEVCCSLDDLKEYINHNCDQTFFVIGGEQIYKLLLPYCEKAIVTHIDASFDADAYFPDLKILPNWKMINESDPVLSKMGAIFHVSTYVNQNKLMF